VRSNPPAALQPTELTLRPVRWPLVTATCPQSLYGPIRDLLHESVPTVRQVLSQPLSTLAYRAPTANCLCNSGHETGRLKMRDMNLRQQFARVEIAGRENAGPICRGGKCGKSQYGKPKCEKVSQSRCICVQSYSFSRPISLFDKWMWNRTILDNRTRLSMKLLTTSSANIIQECRVMFGVKSVSKSIFKRRCQRCQIYDE